MDTHLEVVEMRMLNGHMPYGGNGSSSGENEYQSDGRSNYLVPPQLSPGLLLGDGISRMQAA